MIAWLIEHWCGAAGLVGSLAVLLWCGPPPGWRKRDSDRHPSPPAPPPSPPAEPPTAVEVFASRGGRIDGGIVAIPPSMTDAELATHFRRFADELEMRAIDNYRDYNQARGRYDESCAEHYRQRAAALDAGAPLCPDAARRNDYR